MKIRRKLLVGAVVGWSAGAGVAPAIAESSVAGFYRGKTVSLVVGHEVGSGYDVYARVLARHLGRHIPGEPAIVVQNMVGAAGMIAANWLYTIAPRDGAVMATFSASPFAEPILGNPAARFEPAKFTWIGNMDESVGTCGVTKASGVVKFDDLLVKETIFGATAQTGTFGKFALAVKNLLGARYRIVSGYKGSADVRIALNRGEVHGICGLPLSTITSHWRDDYESGNFRPVIQLSGRKHPDLALIPHVDDYARSPEDHQVFGLIFGMQALGRFYVAPPAIPDDRRGALRTALALTMGDPQFRADAAKTQIDISPSSGHEVDAFIARVSASSSTVIDRAKRALRPD
jgi:tripartite-type tricarboxylate transporter receptor subunit TctC